MPTPSTLRPCPPAPPPRQPDAPLLRDLVNRHAEPLAQLLQDHLSARSAGAGRDFQAGAAAWRQQGPQRFSSWLFGITLGLLRQASAGDVRGGAGNPGENHPGAIAPDFAHRLAQALPAALAGPLQTLAQSGLDDTGCALFLCKPAAVALPDEQNRIQT